MPEALPCVNCSTFRTTDGRGAEGGFLVDPEVVERDFPRFARALKKCHDGPEIRMIRRSGALGAIGVRQEAHVCLALENALKTRLGDQAAFDEGARLIEAINLSANDFFARESRESE